MKPHAISRRGFLYNSGALMAWSFMPRIASAAPNRDPRFVTIILRGALDGLAAVAPAGDPNYERIRNGLILPSSGKGAGIKLDGFFHLNPNMPAFAALYAKGEALVVHAAATPYRERSHFDGQDVLESGQGGAGQTKSGWLNRALGVLPKGERVRKVDPIALGAEIPLIMRGPASVVSLMGPASTPASDDTRQRLLDLYSHTNPELAKRFSNALELDESLGGDAGRRALMKEAADSLPASMAGAPDLGQLKAFRTAGVEAGRLLAKPDGPRVGAMSLLGWDTHAGEGPLDGRLGRLLGALDQTIDGLRSELGAAWRETVVVVATEFGRTARMNGTSGTDHGTATAMFLAGGALRGGRVIADWPGLAEAALHEGRDLRPTTDARSVFKGLLRDHLGLAEAALEKEVFPQSAAAKPMSKLLSA